VTPAVDFFRVDRSGATKRRLGFAGILVAIGSTAIGAHLVTRLPADLAHLVALGGGLVMVTGLLTGFGTMALMLFENVYLLIKDDGVLLHDNGKETTIPWDALDAAERREGFVVLKRRDAAALEWFAGRAAPDVAKRVDEARRKAIHGLRRDS
jgi:hypothetical protein